MKYLSPPDWPLPRGYSNGIQVRGPQVFVAGMIGWDANGLLAEGFIPQLEQVLRNIVAVLAEADAGPEHVVRMTWYVKGLGTYRDNLAEIGQTYRRVMGKNFPTMAVVGVSDLVERGAMIEIEATAVIPE